MPYFNGATQTLETVGASFKSAGGDMGTFTMPTQSTITPVELQGAIQDIAEVSNAGLLEYRKNLVTKLVAKSTLIAYDEAHSAAGMKLITIWENTTTGQRVTVPVPAPDQEMFAGDGVQVNPLETKYIQCVAAIGVILNGGALGTTIYNLLQAYRADYRTKLPKPRLGEVAVEPAPAGPPA